MDPITAGLILANSIVVLLTKVWDAMTPEDKKTNASDVTKTLHNSSTFLQNAQEHMNQLVQPSVKP